MVPTACHPLVVLARRQGAVSTDEAMALLGVSRATAQRRLRDLVAAGQLVREGAGRGSRYVVAGLRIRRQLAGLEEDRLWAEVRPILEPWGLGPPELATVGYAFTEMVNNAIDHSGGRWLLVEGRPVPGGVVIQVADDGRGVFRCVREAEGLAEDFEAVFVLEKGRFTTQPLRHSGEGIFFSSKAANRYRLESGRVAWITDGLAQETAIQLLPDPRRGTRVTMEFVVGRVPVLADLFRQWTDPDTLSFERTKTTVKLAGFGVQLLSRSEARRVTTGLERFRHVTVDFAGVELVGQGFCDEIFRVFAAGHPTVVLAPVAMNESVAFMVRRVPGA